MNSSGVIIGTFFSVAVLVFDETSSFDFTIKANVSAFTLSPSLAPFASKKSIISLSLIFVITMVFPYRGWDVSATTVAIGAAFTVVVLMPHESKNLRNGAILWRVGIIPREAKRGL